MQIEHIDISGMGKRVGKDSLSLRRKETHKNSCVSLFFVYLLGLHNCRIYYCANL